MVVRRWKCLSPLGRVCHNFSTRTVAARENFPQRQKYSIVKKATKCYMCHSAQCSMIATVGVGTSGDKLVHLLNTDNKEQYTLGLPLTTHYVISKSQITQLMTLSKLHHTDVVCVTSPEV